MSLGRWEVTHTLGLKVVINQTIRYIQYQEVFHCYYQYHTDVKSNSKLFFYTAIQCLQKLLKYYVKPQIYHVHKLSIPRLVWLFFLFFITTYKRASKDCDKRRLAGLQSLKFKLKYLPSCGTRCRLLCFPINVFIQVTSESISSQTCYVVDPIIAFHQRILVKCKPFTN